MIRQPIWAFISGVLLIIIVGYALERISFLQRAERTIGNVIQINSRNTSCGGRRTRHSCTKFNARVQFLTTVGARQNLSVSAGSARGYDQPVSRASLNVGDGVSVVYDPDQPTKAYEDSLWGVWGVPISLAMFQLASLFASVSEPRKKQMG